MMAPCKNCEKRQLGCHATCEEYQAFEDYKKKTSEEKIREHNTWTKGIENQARLKAKRKWKR